MNDENTASLPPSPITPLGVALVALFEEFRGLVAAGFTEGQALRLLAYQIQASGEGFGPPPRS